MDMMNLYKERLGKREEVTRMLEALAARVLEVGDLLVTGLRGGGKLLVCGNGGSAADAQHFAAEIVGRFQKERAAWPAIALTTDTSILTAIGNDFGFDRVFSRQVEGLGRAGDILIGISTSGNSRNVVEAVEMAREKRMTTIGMLGGDGGRLEAIVDHALVVPDTVTARVQEAHIFLIHYLAEHIESRLEGNDVP